jgi:hypothetical protein
MKSNKLNQVHVYIIGGVLMFIVGVGMFFALLKPLNDENEALRGRIQSVETEAVRMETDAFTISNVPGAEAKLVALEQRRNQREAEMLAREARVSLPASQEINIGDGSADYIIERTLSRWLVLPRNVVTLMERHAQSLARKHGVEVQTQFAAPAPSTDPNSIPRQIIAWNLGGMSMSGDFNRVMNWVQDWNNAPLLVSVDGLRCSLEGRGGRISATANLTAYVFPKGEAVTIPGAGGGGGGMMGGMGGMMGGMGGMMGGGGMGGASGGMSGGPPVMGGAAAGGVSDGE